MYKSYKEAKAAHPDCDAVVASTNKSVEEFGGEIEFMPVDISNEFEDGYQFCGAKGEAPVIRNGYWKICNPSDYENKPKTVVDYEKVEFKRASKAVEYFESYVLDEEDVPRLYHSERDEFIKLNHVKQVALFWSAGNLYRKVEREVTWQEEVKRYLDSCVRIGPDDKLSQFTFKEEEMSPEVDKVNDEFDSEFVGLCHLVESMTDNPNK